jgi:hypothetical protein
LKTNVYSSTVISSKYTCDQIRRCFHDLIHSKFFLIPWRWPSYLTIGIGVMVFNVTFNYISVISWWSVLEFIKCEIYIYCVKNNMMFNVNYYFFIFSSRNNRILWVWVN